MQRTAIQVPTSKPHIIQHESTPHESKMALVTLLSLHSAKEINT